MLQYTLKNISSIKQYASKRAKERVQQGKIILEFSRNSMVTTEKKQSNPHSEQEMTSSSCRSHYIFNSSLNYVIIKNWRELCFLSRGNLIFSIFVVGCYQIVSGT